MIAQALTLLWILAAGGVPAPGGDEAGRATAAAASLSVGRDYQPGHRGWNGLADFVALAQDLGCPVVQQPVLDWEALEGQDVLFLLYPETPLDGGHLVSFLSAGGRAVLADDYGQAGAAFTRLGLTRHTGALPLSAPTYRGDGSPGSHAALLLAASSLLTPLSRSTPELVTNHPAYLQQIPGQCPGRFSFAFRSRSAEGAAVEEGFGLVMERAVGAGQIVALSDPSLFINNMLEIHGNRLFAAHLVSEMCRAGRDRLLLFHGPFAQRGAPRAVLHGAPAARSAVDQADALNQGLLGANLHIQETLSGKRQVTLFGLRAVTLTGLVLGLAALLLLLRYLPLAPAAHDGSFARAAQLPGMTLWALIRRYGQGGAPHGYLYPAVLVREEVLLRLQPYLAALPRYGEQAWDRTSPDKVAELLTQQVSQRAGALGAILWRELRQLPGRNLGDLADAGRLRARVSRRRLHRLHELAMALFAELSARKPLMVDNA